MMNSSEHIELMQRPNILASKWMMDSKLMWRHYISASEWMKDSVYVGRSPNILTPSAQWVDAEAKYYGLWVDDEQQWAVSWCRGKTFWLLSEWWWTASWCGDFIFWPLIGWKTLIEETKHYYLGVDGQWVDEEAKCYGFRVDDEQQWAVTWCRGQIFWPQSEWWTQQVDVETLHFGLCVNEGQCWCDVEAEYYCLGVDGWWVHAEAKYYGLWVDDEQQWVVLRWCGGQIFWPPGEWWSANWCEDLTFWPSNGWRTTIQAGFETFCNYYPQLNLIVHWLPLCKSNNVPWQLCLWYSFLSRRLNYKRLPGPTELNPRVDNQRNYRKPFCPSVSWVKWSSCKYVQATPFPPQWQLILGETLASIACLKWRQSQKFHQPSEVFMSCVFLILNSMCQSYCRDGRLRRLKSKKPRPCIGTYDLLITPCQLRGSWGLLVACL